MDNQELVLFYGLDDVKSEILTSIMGDIGIDCRRIGTIGRDWKIRDLLDESRHSTADLDNSAQVPEPAESVAILNGLTDQRINDFLAAVREADGLSIDLKAVVTEHNLDWRLSDLISELKQENALMKIYMAIRSQIRNVREWLKDENLINNKAASVIKWRQEIELAVNDAQAAITACEQNGELDPELLEKNHQRLNRLMNVSFSEPAE